MIYSNFIQSFYLSIRPKLIILVTTVPSGLCFSRNAPVGHTRSVKKRVYTTPKQNSMGWILPYLGPPRPLQTLKLNMQTKGIKKREDIFQQASRTISPTFFHILAVKVEM